MSVELDVRLSRPFEISRLIAEMGVVFDEVGIQPHPAIEIRDEAGNVVDEGQPFEVGEWLAHLIAEGNAVQMLTAFEESDLWLTVATGSRDPDHYALMLLVAVAVAQLSGTEVVDHSGWLGPPGASQPAEIVQRISARKAAVGPIHEVADRLVAAAKAIR